MGIQDILAKRRSRPRVEKVAAEGFGDVRIKRLKTSEAWDLPDDDWGIHLLIACLLDEDDKPVFSSVEDVRKEDSDTITCLIRECKKINVSPGDESKKK